MQSVRAPVPGLCLPSEGQFGGLFSGDTDAPERPEDTDVGDSLRELSSQTSRSGAFNAIWGTAFQSEHIARPLRKEWDVKDGQLRKGLM